MPELISNEQVGGWIYKMKSSQVFENTPKRVLERPYSWSSLSGGPLRACLVADAKTRRDAYALRYESYLADGHIDPNPARLFSDKHDGSTSSHTLVVYAGTTAVGTARISVMDVLDSDIRGTIPAEAVFPDEIKEVIARIPETDKPKHVVEIARLVTHPGLAADTGLVFLLFQLVNHLITELDADVLLSCVRRNHLPFYRRMQFEPVAGPRPYVGVKFDAWLTACPRSSFGESRRRVPVLNASPSMQQTYAGLLRGADVLLTGAVSL